jgi:hypothetical protein
MKTKCKFQINQIKKSEDGKEASVSATAVMSGSKENDSFFAMTPAGSLSFHVVNPAALEGLSEGDEVFLTIEKAEAVKEEGSVEVTE